MKKAMLFIVALLFSVSVSAASLHIDAVGSSNATQATGLNDGRVVTGSGLTQGGYWNSDFDVTSSATQSVVIEWSFNPEAASVDAILSVFGAGVDVAYNVFGDFMTTLVFLAGETYFVDFFDVSSTALQYDVSISDVPVPAALFLFAPALLGFLGLRRKAALAA